MKFLFIVLDGLGDIGKPTPLKAAHTPALDKLAQLGRCGQLDVGYGKYVNSDFGFLNLLGCYSKSGYPGRGYLEALGAGLKPKAADICIRGNFATLDKSGNLIDRRAGRDERGLDSLAEKLDGIEIDRVRFTVKKSTGHRVVLILSGENLSDKVVPNDPMKTGVPLPQIGAKDPEAKRTASVLNKFIYRANKILAKESVNAKRKLPANTILIRNVGRKKETESFRERYGLKACCIAGIAIAHGVSRWLGMNVIPVKGATGKPDTNLAGKFFAALNALGNYDFVWLHINGTDILSHDGLRDEKRKFIERIDGELEKLLQKVTLSDLVIITTCDHRTVSLPDYKAYRHLTDPVPVLISGGQIKPDVIDEFTEANSARGFRLKGDGLLPFVFGLIKQS